MRVEVRDGDVAWNPHANGGAGGPIAGGWRAEVVGPEEVASSTWLRYQWWTLFDASYPVNPVVTAPGGEQGKPIWQVVTQWHQGDNDTGSSPPVALIVVKDSVALHLNRHDGSEVGVWPIAPLARGTWHRFRLDVRWHLTDGMIRMWHNGVRVQFPRGGQSTTVLTGLETLFPAQPGSSHAPTTYLKMGLYRKAAPDNAPAPFIVYHDDATRYRYRPTVTSARDVLRRVTAAWPATP
jgi:hypothetical protein